METPVHPGANLSIIAIINHSAVRSHRSNRKTKRIKDFMEIERSPVVLCSLNRCHTEPSTHRKQTQADDNGGWWRMMQQWWMLTYSRRNVSEGRVIGIHIGRVMGGGEHSVVVDSECWTTQKQTVNLNWHKTQRQWNGHKRRDVVRRYETDWCSRWTQGVHKGTMHQTQVIPDPSTMINICMAGNRVTDRGGQEAGQVYAHMYTSDSVFEKFQPPRCCQFVWKLSIKLQLV